MITDYKSSRRPRPGEGAPAGQGLAPAVDLRDGLRGDDRPAAGRGRAPLPRHGARRDGAGRPQADRQGARVDPDRGRAGSAPGTSRPSPTTCRAAAARSGRSARPARCADGGSRSRPTPGWRSRPSSRAGARGAVVEADNLERAAARCPTAASTSPTPTRRSRPAARSGCRRSGPAAASRRGAGSAAATYRYEVVSDIAWSDDLPLDAHLEALHARLVEIHRVLAAHGSLYLHVDWRTAHHARLLLDEVFGADRFLNELVWAYDYGGRRARPLAAQARHDPVVREGRRLDVRARGDRPDPVPRARARRPGEGGARQAADRRVVDDDRPAGIGGADGLPDPEAGPAARAHRRGIEPAGGPRPRSVRGQRHDRRRRGAPRSSLAAGRPQPRRRSRSPARGSPREAP